MRGRLRLALSPPAQVGQVDTGLRFTDVLFGFVIRDLFLRLQEWSKLDLTTKLQLIVGSVLVLGSWIGFRRSIHRPQYEVKFFNVPFFMFIADQLMIILYFRIATLTPLPPAPGADDLSRRTLELLAFVFALYVIWDVLGIVMAKAKMREDTKPKYPEVVEKTMTEQAQRPGWTGLSITLACLAVLIPLWRLAPIRATGAAEWLLLLTVVVLLGYRLAKEVRTSWESL